MPFSFECDGQVERSDWMEAFKFVRPASVRAELDVGSSTIHPSAVALASTIRAPLPISAPSNLLIQPIVRQLAERIGRALSGCELANTFIDRSVSFNLVVCCLTLFNCLSMMIALFLCLVALLELKAALTFSRKPSFFPYIPFLSPLHLFNRF